MNAIFSRLGTQKLNSGLCVPFAALLLVLIISCASAQDLRLTAEQKQKIKAYAADTRSGIQAQREALRTARQELTAVYTEYKLDESRAKKAMGKLGKAQQQLMEVHLNNQLKIRDILTQDQFDKFQQMMKKRMHGPRQEKALFKEDKAFELGVVLQIEDDLKLSADQRKRVESLLKPARSSGIMQDIKQSTEQLDQLYENYNLDAAAARKLMNNIHRDQMKLTKNAHSRQQAIRSILTEDQFSRLRQEILKRMDARQGQGGPRRAKD